MQYVLHIGTNKTGTSTLQHYLGTYRDDLLKQGIWYPKVGKHPFAHHDVAQAFKEKSALAARGIDPDAILNGPANADATTVLLSSEAFHTINSIEDIVSFFPPDRTRIVLYLREHVAYLASWYQQAVQARTITCSFPEFAVLYGQPFRDLVTRWREGYGENVKLRVYARDRLHQGDIVADFFLTAFGTPPPCERTFEDKNPSISGNLLFLKLVLNHFLTPEENSAIVEELSALARLDERFGGKFEIAEREVRRIARRFGEDRRYLAEECGLRFGISRDAIAGHSVPDQATLRDDVGLIFGLAKKRGFALHEIALAKSDLLFPKVL